MKEVRKPEYPEKIPDELQNKPHTKARKFKPQPRIEPSLKHWLQARKADVLTMTTRIAPNMTCQLHAVQQAASLYQQLAEGHPEDQMTRDDKQQFCGQEEDKIHCTRDCEEWRWTGPAVRKPLEEVTRQALDWNLQFQFQFQFQLKMAS